MTRSFSRLASVLRLEAEQGYKNKAVVGGIRQFVTFWVSQAEGEAVDEADKAFIAQTAELLGDYAKLPGTEARASLVNRLLEKLYARDAKLGDAPPPAQTTAETERPPAPPPTQQPPPVASPPAPKPETAAPSPPRSRSQPTPSADPAGLAQPTTALYGVGPRIALLLEKLGVYTLHDLLYLFPRRYDDYSLMKPINKLKYGEKVTVIGTLWEVRARRLRNNQTLIQGVVSDGTGNIQVNWYNQPWLKDKLKAGLRIVLQGQVDQYLGRPVFNSPEWEMIALDALQHDTIVPVYPLTQGLSSHRMRQMMKAAVVKWASRVPDPLPQATLERLNLYSLPQALFQIHLPENQEKLMAARRRLIFDELFVLQLGMLAQRRDWQAAPAQLIEADSDLLARFVSSLPYEMTQAQKRVVGEILADMARPVPMNRMLQGDVGAGKTVVAAAAMMAAVSAGKQAALMAPTEILAEQHYQGLGQLLEPLGIRVVALTGSLGAAAKREALEMISDGSAHVIIGTHALIQPDVTYANLGLAVIDEQHRFGVDQRGTLKQRGPIMAGEQMTPHVLVMSATPIPRSLALSLYGDLDLSILDEMPPGRQEIQTRWVRSNERERAYRFVRSQVEKGRQAYIICPLVEESDKIEAVAAVEEHARLQTEVFPDLRLGLVHGRLKADEKEATMRQFYAGELNVLVATSVIEVGVDVPNSTVMLIEGANRFGLAQLHQFRGRVGRGQHQSYCLLVADDTTGDAEERLTALEQTNDGFQLAEKDLELRGPGEFFGRRQSGLPNLRLASLTDMTMLQLAREEAERIGREDPLLQAPEYKVLYEKVAQFWEDAADVS